MVHWGIRMQKRGRRIQVFIAASLDSLITTFVCNMKTSVLVWSCLAAVGLALPQPDRTLQKRAPVTVTAPAPDATYVGVQIGEVDQFQAIPYVQ